MIATPRRALTQEVVLLYTTAAEIRPTYRRGILDCLSYPEGHLLRYSYRFGQVHPDLRKQDGLPRGANAVIIFVDEATKGTYTYYPLRRVRILQGLPIKGALTDRERFEIFLELREFVAYAHLNDPTQWNERIAALDQVRNIRDDKPEFFLIRASDFFTAALVSPLTAWENIVTNISRSHDLANCVFLKLERPKEFDTQKPLQLEGSARIPQYAIRGGEVYSLDLAVYDAKRTEARLLLKSSSDDIVQVNQPFQSIVSGLAQKSAIVACRRTIERRLVALSVEVIEESPGASTKSIVTSPNPVLLLRVVVPKWTLALFVILVLFGTFLVSWDSEVVREISDTAAFRFWGIAAKSIGASALAIAAWIAFRKLPSQGA
jgi:hypothetical protein